MANLQKEILELNYLGCYITQQDNFKSFDLAWREKIMHIAKPEPKIDALKANEVIRAIEKSVLRKAKETYPVVLLSGGVDSTLIASILKHNNIDFTCYSYVLGKDDPTLHNVRYVEKVLGIKSNLIHYELERVKAIWCNYHKFYASPTLDYAALIMADFLGEMKSSLSVSDFTLFDGIGADDLFGCGGITAKNYLRSLIFNLVSNKITRPIKFKSRRINIYTSSVINSIFANTLYQNFIFSKLLHRENFQDSVNYLSSILIKNNNIRGDFYFGHTLMNLYYDGRRVAHKNSGLSDRFEVYYPFLQDDILDFGLRLDNQLKVKPHIKEPLKLALVQLGFNSKFVYGQKQGFIFNIFDIISIHEILDNMNLIEENFKLKPDYKNYLNGEYQNRDASVDHFLFGLAMTQKYLSAQKYQANVGLDECISSF